MASNRPELRYAWCGSSIFISDTLGRAGDHPLTGFFFRQARYLRELRLLIAGEQPYMCSICEADLNQLELTFIHPEVERGGGGGSGSGGLALRNGLLYRDLDIRVHYRVRPASLEVTVQISNRWQQAVVVPVSWHVGVDYATMDDAQFDKARATSPIELSIGESLRFRSQDAKLPFETILTATGAHWTYTAGEISAQVELPQQQTCKLTLTVRAVDHADPIDSIAERAREERLEHWQHGAAVFHSAGETPLSEIGNRCIRDLGSFASLEGPEDEWLVPSAGVPIYQSIWARDALTASWQAGLFDGAEMVQDVLRFLDRRQGTRVDPDIDEQPGRILNQAKNDPDTRRGLNPYARYYADVASPFMFIIALGYGYIITGRKELIERHWQAARAVIAWAKAYGDRDGDGYIEYLTTARTGPRHQGWKDSDNAVVDEYGAQVAPPIAPCEIQGYYFASLQYMAGMALMLGLADEAREFWRAASELKARFNRDFWMEEEGFVAFGLDAEKNQIRAITSNAAQCLPTGIIHKANVPRLVRRMFQPDLFSGWGLRTLSSKNPAYHPLDYHLGTIWPVENASIVFGLRRYGMNDRALQLIRALYDLARLWPGGRIPECVGGYARDEFSHPGTYPRANRPQTWNQSVFPLLLQCVAGVIPFAPTNTLLVDPILPIWLPELTIKNLRVGDANTTVRFWRNKHGESEYEVVEMNGDLHVIRQPWLESLSTNLWDRLQDLVETLVH